MRVGRMAKTHGLSRSLQFRYRRFRNSNNSVTVIREELGKILDPGTGSASATLANVVTTSNQGTGVMKWRDGFRIPCGVVDRRFIVMAIYLLAS